MEYIGHGRKCTITMQKVFVRETSTGKKCYNMVPFLKGGLIANERVRKKIKVKMGKGNAYGNIIKTLARPKLVWYLQYHKG